MHSQKLKVNYLPAEGQALEEEEEVLPRQLSMMSGDETVCLSLLYSVLGSYSIGIRHGEATSSK